MKNRSDRLLFYKLATKWLNIIFEFSEIHHFIEIMFKSNE